MGATTLGMPFCSRKLFMISKNLFGSPLETISAYVFITESCISQLCACRLEFVFCWLKGVVLFCVCGLCLLSEGKDLLL